MAKRPSGSEGKYEFTEFALEGLKSHNEYRNRHGVPELTLSEQLCQFAQEWANKSAAKCKMEHRDKCPYGENIYACYSSDVNQLPSAGEVVKAWYSEIKDHKFGKENVNPKTLHFTQVVWKATTQMGIAYSKGKEGHVFVVANYDPKGNFVGQFVENVTPAKHSKKSTSSIDSPRAPKERKSSNK